VRLRKTGGETLSESTTDSEGSFTLGESNPGTFGDRTIYALPKYGCKVAKFQTHAAAEPTSSLSTEYRAPARAGARHFRP